MEPGTGERSLHRNVKQKGSSYMLWITKKRVLALTAVGVLAVTAGAYAYFTSTGSGTATATVGSGSAVTIKGTVSSNLYPGGSSPVTFTIDNPSSAAQRVGTITLASIAVDAGHSTCSKVIGGGNPDFAMPGVVVNKTFPTGNGQSVTPTGTLTMNDTGVSQDACQGATLTLNLTSN
jgi:hypothetical protein